MEVLKKISAAGLLSISIFVSAVVFSAPAPVAAQDTAAACASQGGTWSPNLGPDGFTPDGTGTCQPAGTSASASKTIGNAAAAKCEGWTGFFLSPVVCIGRSLGAFVASALITLSAKLLELSGLLFNWVVYYTLIAFGDAQNGFLTKSVLDAINLVWTVFRDISNILIIGIFAFIAISIILGLEKFGQKKLIANVLIVAILINFSLLFTKVIIDASNFTAYQFYKATNVAAAPVTTTTTAGIGSFSQDGIAGSFIKFMGITSIGDTYTALQKGADNIDNGALVLLHGVFSATVLLAAALVLLYGSFLVVSRAILIVFLMITSSLAFASYLIPKAAESAYGWNTWWKSLINVAIFGPLLMMLLWATLAMAEALAPESGTLGALLTNPQQAGNLSALFSYVVVLGMLFGSFKIASAFSTHISGFNFAAMIPAIGFGMAARMAGMAGMGTLGVAGRYVGNKAATASRLAEGRGQSWRAGMFDIAARSAKTAAKTDFNLANTALGKQIAATAGLKGVLAGQSSGKGVAGLEKAIKEGAAAKADRRAPTKEDIATLQKEAMTGAAKGMATEISKATGVNAADVTHKTLEESTQAMQSERKAMQEGMEAQLKQLQEERSALSKIITDTGSPEASNRLKQVGEEIVGLAEHKTRLDEQDARIKTAQELTDTMKARAQSALPASIKIEGNAAEIAKKVKEETAVRFAHERLTNLPFRAAGWNTVDTDAIAQGMRKALKERDEHKQLKKIAEEIHKMSDETKEHHVKEAKHEKKMEHAADKATEHAAKHDDHGPKH